MSTKLKKKGESFVEALKKKLNKKLDFDWKGKF